MVHRVYGHSPRYRRMKNRQLGYESRQEISIDTNQIISTIVSSAIGAAIGSIVTNQISK